MNNSFSFRNAFESLPANCQPEVKQKIMDKLNIKETAFYRRMKGIPEPRVTEAQNIEAIFAEYKIVDVWGAEVDMVEAEDETV
ncbi:MAG: hypothetical protein FWD09_02330 [Lentimicrobiaceae bacterium]|nr:hypothetical protein [Lentimicrobiaceae bacterium]